MRYARDMLLTSLALLLVLPAHANNGGKTGSSTAGCNGCHSGGTAPTVALSAAATTVLPGSVSAITFTVPSRAGSQTAAGFHASATGGTLASGTRSQLLSGELTHSGGRLTNTSGAAAWSFNWTAPTTEGTYTLRAAGNSVNANGGTSGDSSATTTLTIVVDDGCDDLDADGVTDCAGDCDDTRASIRPGASETCDGVDQDCDGTIDDAATDATTWFRDADSDGFGSAGTTLAACTVPSGYVARGTDCDDTRAGVFPGATESCDGIDQDCDGTVDDSASDAATWFLDADADGYGSATSPTARCTAPTGYVAGSTDCDDGRASVNPGATEVCDASDRDEDCDGRADDADTSASGKATWYADADGDSYGAGAAVLACDASGTLVALAGDCDDTSSGVRPGATETCTDTVDLNCDGTVGRVDDDGDGYAACEECDDASGAVSPGATETCNLVDDDCDGTVDERDAADAATWYADVDGDGFGDAASAVRACTAPAGYLAEASDCDDAAADAFPGAAEVWYDDVDQDCNGLGDGDQDGDGVDAVAAGGTDCDDLRADVYPGAADAPYDGTDADCAGNSDLDADGDGVDSASFGGADCDDARADTYPGAPDTPYDGVVTDCVAADEYDADDDGHDVPANGGDDCDDARSDVHPGMQEVWYDGVDQDCDGNDTDQDGDGVASADDCDDTDPGVTACDTGDGGDSGVVLDTDGDDQVGGPDDDGEKDGGCASTGSAPVGAFASLLALLGLAVRGRRRS